MDVFHPTPDKINGPRESRRRTGYGMMVLLIGKIGRQGQLTEPRCLGIIKMHQAMADSDHGEPGDHIEGSHPHDGHKGGPHHRMGMMAFGQKIACADIEKEPGKKREKQSER